MEAHLGTSNFGLTDFFLMVFLVSNLFCLLIIISKLASISKASERSDFNNPMIKLRKDNHMSEIENTSKLREAVLGKLDELNTQATRVHTAIELLKHQARQKSYNIIGANDVTTLENEIRNWQARKWVTTGGVVCDHSFDQNSEAYGRYRYYQAIIRLDI
jgi:hypothetical protein